VKVRGIKTPFNWSIYALNGQLLGQGRAELEGESIDLSRLSHGLHLLKCVNPEGKTYTTRLMILNR
jgi:hypothetical protein